MTDGKRSKEYLKGYEAGLNRAYDFLYTEVGSSQKAGELAPLFKRRFAKFMNDAAEVQP